MTIREQFASLPLPSRDSSALSFWTQELGGGPYRIGKDSDGGPALVLVAADGDDGLQEPSIELQHVRVQYGVQCHLYRDGAAPETSRVTLVHCRGADRAMTDYFLAVVSGILPDLDGDPTSGRIRRAISGLVELFSALAHPARKTVQGLWGELFIIARATDPASLVGAWHVAPQEPYDFLMGPQRLEAKTSSLRDRRHPFALEQLRPRGTTDCVVASLFVERAGGGVSVGALLQQTRVRLASRPDLCLRLDRVTAELLGSSWQTALSDAFDWELACDSLQFFPSASIPAIERQAIAEEISHVHFRVDLARVEPLPLAALRRRGPLFEAVMPT